MILKTKLYIMKTRFKYIASVVAVASVLILPACEKDFLDINTDPKNPTDLPLTQILPSAETGLAFNLSMNIAGLNAAASTFVHQLVNFRVEEYVVDGTNFQNAWSQSGGTYGLYSGTLKDLETVIEKGKAGNAPHFVGIAQVQKAYIFSILVDLFGDVPYSEALKGNEFLTPKFDKDSEVYESVLKLLDESITNLTATTSSISPDNTNEFIYGGDRAKWVRLAKTIKLKMLNQIRLTRDVKAEMNALITEGNLILVAADDFQIRFGTSSSPENRNPGFVANYNAAAQRESWVSPFFYNVLKNSGDPRMPYYVYNQLTPTNNPANPTDYRDGRFVSRRFASQGPNKSFDQRNFQSLVGLFPVGGRYDDGAGGTGTLTNGPSDAHLRLLPSYMTKFILAEAALTVGTNGTPRTLLEEGIRAHFAKVNAYAATVPGSVQTVPQIPAATINTYVNTVLANYDLATAAGKLEIIMTQKWIAGFGFGIDLYTDYRRTGYPVIPDPVTDADPETQSQRTFPNRFPYPNSEISSNPKAPAQPDVYTTKIFWDK
jgi:hypothetical protein